MKYVYSINKAVINLWTPLVGLNFTSKNSDKINLSDSYIVVMNHVNVTDIFLANKCLKIPGKPLIKKETLHVPILGWLFRMSAVPVVRNDKQSRNLAYKSLKKALNKGDSLLIFPEGSRNNDSIALDEFKLGAFRLSIETGVKILPVVAINSRSIGNDKSLIIKPGSAQLHYLPPLDPSKFKGSADKLKEHCYNHMKKEILSFDLSFRTN